MPFCWNPQWGQVATKSPFIGAGLAWRSPATGIRHETDITVSGRLKRRQQLLARVDPLVIAAIAAGRSGGVERRVVLSGQAEVRNRGWSLGIPDSGIGLCNQGPDLSQAVLDRLDVVGQVSEYDELVWDYAARCVSSPQRIGEAQRDLPGGAVTCPSAPSSRSAKLPS